MNTLFDICLNKLIDCGVCTNDIYKLDNMIYNFSKKYIIKLIKKKNTISNIIKNTVIYNNNNFKANIFNINKYSDESGILYDAILIHETKNTKTFNIFITKEIHDI